MKRYITLGLLLVVLFVGTGLLIHSCTAEKEQTVPEQINVEPEPEYDEDGSEITIDNTPRGTFDGLDDIPDAGEEPFDGGGDAGERPVQ